MSVPQDALAQLNAYYETQKKIEAEMAMIKHQQALHMAVVNNQANAKSALGAYSSQLGQVAQAHQGWAAAGQGLGAYTQAAASPAGTPVNGPTRQLAEVAALLGIEGAVDDYSGWDVLTKILAEIVRRTGIQQPLKREVDLIDALNEAKGN